MSWGVSDVSRTLISVNQGAHTVTYTLVGYVFSDESGDVVTNRFQVWLDGISQLIFTASPGPGSFLVSGGGVSSNYEDDGHYTFAADEAGYGWNARVVSSFFGAKNATTLSFKSHAVTATSSTPSASGVTASGANISCNFYPNTLDSTVTATLQYKKASDSTWTDATTSGYATSGYTQTTASATLSGLSASTQYHIRLSLTRTTVNDTSLTSATGSFTTLAGEPSVTTAAATNVAATSAILHATVTVNDGTSVQVYWKYGASNPPTENTTTPQNVSSSGSFEQAISSLTASSTYYHQAFVTFATPTGSPNNGSVASFATPANPLADAALEDHVLLYEFDRKYGVITDGAGQAALVFSVADVASSSSDRFLNAGVPWIAGDVKISIDGGAVANTTNLPTRIGSTPLYTLTLTATEMQGNDIMVYLVDADGPAWRDTLLHVRTHMTLGTLDIDAATGQKANTTAFKATGYGSGNGASFVAGATGQDIDGVLGDMVLATGTVDAGSTGTTLVLAAGGSSSDDVYIGALVMITSGTGVGQCRTITDYNGTTKTLTVNRTWAVTPAASAEYIIMPGPDVWNTGAAAELASVPASTGNYGLLLQLVFQRFAFKITQTATVQTLFKANNSDTLSTRSVSDNGTTQTVGKLS